MGANQSASYTLTINDCVNYPQQLVYFRNALGGVDSYNFKMKNRKAIGAERSTYSRNSDVYGTTCSIRYGKHNSPSASTSIATG